MRRRFLCVMLAVFALSVQTLADGLSTDARLQKVITLQLHTALLDEVMQEISQQTQVPFLLDDSLKERKATLFVSRKPAWQVLSKLFSLIGIQWQREDNAYRLTPDPEIQRLEQSLVQWERESMRRTAEKMLSTWAQQAREDYATILQRVRQTKERLAELQEQKPPGWQDRRAVLSAQMESLEQVAHLDRYLAGRMYRQTPAGVWARLWRGETLWFSYPHDPRTLPLPADCLRWKAIEGANPPVSLYFGIRFCPQQGRLLFTLMAVPEGAAPSTDAISQSWEQMDPSEAVSHPLIARWEKWKTSLEEVEKNLPLLQAGKPKGRFGQPTLADWLEMIAKASNLQVIADAFRLPVPPMSARTPHATLASWLKEFLAEQGGYLRVEGDWLLFRHANYWRLLLSEPSERLTREMEHRALQGTLSLEDYANFAAALSPEAQVRLENAETFYTARFDLAPLLTGYPALRFWASLTDSQKKTALQRQPISYLQLTPTQQRLFREALEAKRVPVILLPILFTNGGEVEPQLAFLLERWNQPAYTAVAENLSITAESPEELEQQRHLLSQNVASQQALSEHITFYFGIDAPRSVRYEMSLSKKSSQLPPEDSSLR